MAKKTEKEIKREKLIDNLVFAGTVTLFTGGALWLLYKIWWFFIGSWVFEGPFASTYDAGDTAIYSFVFLFVVIYIIVAVYAILTGK